MIARNTAFTFKGKSIDAKEIGKELGVRYVLEGSVQRESKPSADQRAIDRCRNRRTFVGPISFEEDVADLFKLQDQVVARSAEIR